ncbi:MAG: hypothetical protein U0936_24810 [Planctomycetaceae bacterium]
MSLRIAVANTAKTDHSIEWFVGTLQPDESSDFSLTLRATGQIELLHQAGVISEHGSHDV